jgi:hypothetical protein
MYSTERWAPTPESKSKVWLPKGRIGEAYITVEGEVEDDMSRVKEWSISPSRA